MQIKNFVVLEAIRQTGNSLPHPLNGEWAPLESVINDLNSLNWIERKGKEYKISEEGKRAILLFNSERKELLKPFKDYKKVTVDRQTFDGRLARACQEIKGKLPDELAIEYLTTVNMFITWDSFFDIIKRLNKDSVKWQDFILSSFEQAASDGVKLDVWKKLPEEKNLVQITKHV